VHFSATGDTKIPNADLKPALKSNPSLPPILPQAQLSLLDYLDGYLPTETEQDDNLSFVVDATKHE
jgi:hypothetical protein